MAVKTSTPWWVSGLMLLGLVALFFGQRVFDEGEGHTMVVNLLAWAMLLGATGVRAWAFLRETGGRRKLEGLLLACHGGILLALAVYLFFAKGAEGKTYVLWMVSWLILLIVSTAPLVMVELSLGFVGRDWFPAKGEKLADEAAVESFRVREMATSGLSIGLALSFLMVTCNVAKERDVREDVSYFKTSRPGSATVAMVNKMEEPLKVLLFFPDVNEVADEVESYFRTLSSETGGKVIIERHDRYASPNLAKEHKVNADGSVVLLRGEGKAKKDDEKKDDEKKDDDEKEKLPEPKQSEKLTLPVEFSKARREKLRELDGDVQKALMKVMRAKRVAYFSVGHGELNDPKSAGPMETVDPLAKSTLLKQLMSLLNYEVKDWDGFGKPVPDDCTILFVLAPRAQLLEEETKAIEEYLDGGGALLIGLDPKHDATLGSLEGKLGVTFHKESLADDKEFMVRRHNDSDHTLILTNQFSSHASVTTLGRGGVKSGILLVDPGHLTEHDFMVEEGKDAPKRTWVVRSMSSSFIDVNGNANYDDGEKRDRYNLVASIEEETGGEKNDDGGPRTGMRAMVVADAEVFSDILLRQVPLIQALVVDGVKWLGGEEDLAGETVSEKDVAIEHTKDEDVRLFYGTIVGAPLLVLGIGLLRIRRRSGKTRTTTKTKAPEKAVAAKAPEKKTESNTEGKKS